MRDRLQSSQSQKDAERGHRIDGRLMILCFLTFAIIGYLLSHYLHL
jgi:hypothetical protein